MPTRMTEGLEQLSYDVRFRQLGMEKRRLKRGLINDYKSLWGGVERGQSQTLFSDAQ